VEVAVLPPYVPDTPETRKDCAQLNALVAETDRTIGAALEVLSTSGAGENTIVLFTTDHGPELNRAKMTLYDPGIRVTCMLRVPGSQGRRVGALASTIDILPTLLDLCGIQTPEFVQGRSLAAVCGIESSQQAVRQLPAVGAAMGRRYIVAEKTYHVIYDPSRCIRTNRFKYVMNRLPHQPIQLSVQHSYRIGLDRCGELYGTPRGEEELYDLETDPGERENLAYDPAYSETRAKLRQKLLTVLRETGDPLLDGPIPPRVRVRPQMEWIFDPSVGHFVPRLTDAAPKRLLS
jgi:arylsulfatase A-like enzyme